MNMKKVLHLLSLFLLFATAGFAQNADKELTVSGVVVDKDGLTMPGVAVYIKDNPGRGTATNVDGNFSLKVTYGDKVVFSFMGYKTIEHIALESKSDMRVVMTEDSKQIEEVVVTGLGNVQRKISTVGAITTVDTKQLQTPAPSMSNLLGGRAAGVISLQSSGELANFSFGQGQLLATPLQVAAMMNTIAAGGVCRTPSFVLAVLDGESGEVVESGAIPAARQVFSARTAQRLQQLLTGVVAEGTGRQGAPIHGSAAGKTGTAQTGQFTAEGEEKMNLWFAGFCPADQPAYTVVVLQDGQTDPVCSSARIFAQVCEALWLLEQE